MSFFEIIWNHWFLIALLAPLFFALTNILDIYFVDSVYEDEWDGILIASFFHLLPWLLFFLGVVSFRYPGFEALGLALAAGACLVVSFFFYFRALFTNNDMVVIQALWALSIPTVPFFAWLMADEKLTSLHYAGVGLAFAGALLFSFDKKAKVNNLRKVFFCMLIAVAFSSLAMVLQEQTYTLIGGDFWTGFLLFSAGISLAGLAVLMYDKRSIFKRLSHILRISKKYFFVFLLAECLSLVGILVSQRAIDLSPAVSFVAVIESLQPAFVMFLSFLLVVVFLFFDKKRAQKIYRLQLDSFGTKVIACCIIAGGVYLIS